MFYIPSYSGIDETCVMGVALDEQAAGLDLVAHQHGEGLIGLGRVLDVDLLQDAVLRIHGGLPQLLVGHLAQTLVPLDALALGQLAARGLALGQHTVAFLVGVHEVVRSLGPLSRYSGGMATYT